MSRSDDWVFGYGSLVAENLPGRGSPGGPIWARLGGYERTWNVAMANADPVNDAKHYVDPADGSRPDIHVAFLNLRIERTGGCAGVLIPVDGPALAGFDRREVNYRRVEVGATMDPRPEGRIWTYVGLEAATERFRRGSEAGTTYVSNRYVEAVERGFRAEAWAYPELLASTDPIPVPRRELTLVRRPGQSGH